MCVVKNSTSVDVLERTFMKRIVKIIISLLILISTFSKAVMAQENMIEKIISDLRLNSVVDTDSFKRISVESNTFTNNLNEEITISDDGELLSLFRVNQMANNSNHVTSAKYTAEDYDTFIDSLYKKNYIPNDFYCHSRHLYGNDIWIMSFIKSSDLNVINPFNSVKIGFDAVTGQILFYNRICSFDKEPVPSVSESVAELKALEYLKELNIVVDNPFEKAELHIIDLKDYFEDEYSDNQYALVYKLVLNDSNSGIANILIDSDTGQVIFVDEYESYDGRAFYCLDNASSSDDRYRNTRATNYNNIMLHLGYTSTKAYLGQSSASATTISNYIQGDNSWAFTFSGHGNSSVIAGHNSSGNTVFSYSSSQVQGIWSFVVLDACSTAANSNWANAFQIYDFNTLGRSFVGWSTTVTYYMAKQFSQYFKNAMFANNSATVLSNIYTAIANIPGDDVYYVLYIGDRTTNGHK